MRRFATGVTLVASPGGDALVVNAFMSVSLAPPLVAFSAGKASLTWRRMRRYERLGVNVLPDFVRDIRERAEPGADRLAGFDLCRRADGVPQLEDAIGFLLCAPAAEHPAGDHLIVVAHVLEASTSDGDPLVFFGGTFGTVA
jgi:3-hydroxy-9,10-secoandrosta-1,3,5(10)-triene-9,17-dione monooxygenase reductase component